MLFSGPKYSRAEARQNTCEQTVSEALARHNGRLLSLNGLTTLAAVQTWDGQLPSVRDFDAADSRAVAQALATRPGPLCLPNLRKISPKTLTTLLQKQDVVIPLIETLEFVQEPDGSVTEDVIIPEWAEARQKQQRAAEAAP